MKTVLIATKNQGKVREFEAFFAEKNIQVKSLLDMEEPDDVIEDGETFEDNAVKKAEAIGKANGIPVIADDSGLEVDALNGAPGVYSARYAGSEKSDEANNEKLLRELEGVQEENRTARFVCALAVYLPGNRCHVVRGTCEGRIAFEKRGEHGFGYDPLFYVPELGKMMAELSREEKNQISHRANAMKKLEADWDTLFN
ncbi:MULTISPECIES: XTP/dITP diphosphatase [Alteribacter]|uniref:dITP/XTP pyrophosphatase n=1 Tax=Alteribacter keqinensis TaxID=2483800 RepID=A0A3M7TYH1_9BACI|nr:XTP/dITP diphosphatase [Alteribacter keqinensis]MBM7096544.1 XTP/dITP diphosphatase [Alteribacter salitolerans]RNA70658.1 XTP/dITP diphosphatase [Alteribacter keqinensis]